MPRPIPTREQQLLFNILKGETPTSLEGIDISKLFDLFQRHRLFPISSPVINLLEGADREKWNRAVKYRAIRSLHQTAMLKQLDEVLREEKMDVIPLKGPLLAYLLFGNPTLRHSSDLDILIREKSRTEIINLFGKLGYSLVSPRKNLSNRQWNYYSKHLKHFSLLNKSERMMVELHTRIEDSLALKPASMEYLLKDIEVVEMGGHNYLCMNRNNNFLYLILHGSTHLYKRLFWLRDVFEALKSWDLNHQKILSDAGELGIERLLGLSLLLVKDFFNAIIPSEYLTYIDENKRGLNNLVRSSKKMIMYNDKPRFLVNIRQHIFNFKIRPNFDYKVRSIQKSMHYLYISKFLK